jgi:DNA-binding IclR family transcriptional regulator
LAPPETEADATLVAKLLGVPDTEAARLLDELEAAGCITRATGLVE